MRKFLFTVQFTYELYELGIITTLPATGVSGSLYGWLIFLLSTQEKFCCFCFILQTQIQKLAMFPLFALMYT